MAQLAKMLSLLSPKHVVCDVPFGTQRDDAILAGATMAEVTGMEILLAFNAEVLICLPSLDRPPSIAESLTVYCRGG